MIPQLPMLELLHPAGMVIDSRQYLDHRHQVALGKELMHGARFAFPLCLGGAHRKTLFLEFDMGILPVENMGICGPVSLVRPGSCWSVNFGNRLHLAESSYLSGFIHARLPQNLPFCETVRRTLRKQRTKCTFDP